MGKNFDYDYIIIGSGPAGLAAAQAFTRISRAKVAIVESGDFGGANINTRDLPYAVGLNFAKIYFDATHSSKYGLSGQNLHFNFPTAVNYQEKMAKKFSDAKKAVFADHSDSRDAIHENHADIINGSASFIDANTIIVNNRKYTASRFIIATGAKLSTSEISGVNYVDYLTPETAIKNRRLPKAVCVVGGGASGCEIAQYYAALGIKTLVIERSERLLPREDIEVGRAIEDEFKNKFGITVLTSARVVALEKDMSSKRVVFSKDNNEKMVRVDTVVLATGSMPVVDELGLDNAGVKYKKSGIIVDKMFQTSAKNIYAVGDCIGGESSTDIAAYQGSLLATNLINRTKNLPNYCGFIRTINTFPAVATVGFNEDDLMKHDKHCKHKVTVFLRSTFAGNAAEDESGFVKILADKDLKIIGATIVAPNADTMVQELAMAIRHGFGAAEIASTPHVVNGYGEAVRAAARQIMANK